MQADEAGVFALAGGTEGGEGPRRVYGGDAGACVAPSTFGFFENPVTVVRG